jgi:hypothetical protein
MPFFCIPAGRRIWLIAGIQEIILNLNDAHRLILNLLWNAMAYFIPDHFVRMCGMSAISFDALSKFLRINPPQPATNGLFKTVVAPQP